MKTEAFNPSKTYWKVFNEKENHHGLQYHSGPIKDPLTFQSSPQKSCCPGGIYFTDVNHLLQFGGIGPWVRPVTFDPNNFKVVLDPDGNKWRAKSVILGDRITLYEFCNRILKWQFNNQGYVDLRSLTSLPEGIQFNNQGYVDLSSKRIKKSSPPQIQSNP